MREPLTLESMAFATMIWLGSLFAPYWLWRRLSGREIRQHIAFGGDTQPLWKVLLVLVIAGGWFLAVALYVIIALFSAYRG